jgi:hypothetical protein
MESGSSAQQAPAALDLGDLVSGFQTILTQRLEATVGYAVDQAVQTAVAQKDETILKLKCRIQELEQQVGLLAGDLHTAVLDVEYIQRRNVDLQNELAVLLDAVTANAKRTKQAVRVARGAIENSKRKLPSRGFGTSPTSRSSSRPTSSPTSRPASRSASPSASSIPADADGTDCKGSTRAEEEVDHRPDASNQGQAPVEEASEGANGPSRPADAMPAHLQGLAASTVDERWDGRTKTCPSNLMLLPVEQDRLDGQAGARKDNSSRRKRSRSPLDAARRSRSCSRSGSRSRSHSLTFGSDGANEPLGACKSSAH